MQLALRLSLFRRPRQRILDSGSVELQAWRAIRLEAIYDYASPLLFGLALELTGDPVAAREALARAFAELGQQTSMLADGLTKQRVWLLRQVGRHCLATREGRRWADRQADDSPRLTGPVAKERYLGRALFKFLSPGRRPGGKSPGPGSTV